MTAVRTSHHPTDPRRLPRQRAVAALFVAALMVAGCGGDQGTQSATNAPATSPTPPSAAPAPPASTPTPPPASPAPSPAPSPVPPPASPPIQPVPARPATQAEAVRFLNQATFGATPAEVERVMQIGYAAWLDEQIAMPPQFSHVAQVNKTAARRTDVHTGSRPYFIQDLHDSLWLGMMSTDQLRQRQMFALSQIFVTSGLDGSTYYLGTGMAAYVDMLYDKGFGNFRDLLQSVVTSTAMGAYLSSLYNREDPANGIQADQNLARELMQLFTIGLWELNPDGTRRLDANGQPMATYTTDDVKGIAKVLTGWAIDGANDSAWNNYYLFWAASDMPRQALPMKANARFHSRAEKRFLGVTIPASNTPDPNAALAMLLDRLFNHPNTAPFICKQLIQRFVVSNPSPAYVKRVVDVFNDNGRGVRGDLGAVLKAILLDSEARSAALVERAEAGKIREPVLRMMHVMRVFKARTEARADSFGISLWLYDRSRGLWQNPLASKTVFNFYMPGFAPANSALARRGLVAPEMQIVTQSSVGDQYQFFKDVLQNGGITSCCSDAQRNTYFMRLDYSEWLPLVADPPLLVERLNQVFMAGQMPAALKTRIIAAMAARTQGGSETSGMQRGVAQIKFAEAVQVMLMSPEYVVQK